MKKNNRVVIVEDDLLARGQIYNLLSRDWRTRVVGEFDSFSKEKFSNFVHDAGNKIDTIILDTEVPWNPNWPIEAFEIIEALPHPPKIIFLCTIPISRYWNDILLRYPFYGGYLIKQEIMFSLPSAVNLVENERIVLTNSVLKLSTPVGLQSNMVIVDGTKMIQEFTPRELEILRLSIILNHSHRDIENELLISRDWISEVLGDIYKKLQLPELISGEILAEDIFTDKLIADQVAAILTQFNQRHSNKNLRKLPWLSTLAYHLLTIPEIRKI